MSSGQLDPSKYRRRHSSALADKVLRAASGSEVRSEGRRDRDRLLYSAAFRRLADVTQVHRGGIWEPPIHTRMTHSLKVAQLAETLAERMGDHGFADPDVCFAGGLGHDLGHPPFGHLGEKTLNEILVTLGLEGFEANAQTLRIVTKLEGRHPIDPGLDLTRGSLNALMKYPWVRDTGHISDSTRVQRGVYTLERTDFEFARDSLPDGVLTVEARLVDWSDDVSFALHDLDDFYTGGELAISDLNHDPARLYEAVLKRRQDKNDELDRKSWEKACERLMEIVGRPEFGALQTKYRGERIQRGLLRALTSTLLDRWVEGVSRYGNDVQMDVDHWYEIEFLKQFTYEEVIASSHQLGLQQHRQRQQLHQLFDMTVDWVVSERSWERLPPGLREALMAQAEADDPGMEDSGKELGEAWEGLYRSVADYLASLTESGAVILYGELERLWRGH